MSGCTAYAGTNLVLGANGVNPSGPACKRANPEMAPDWHPALYVPGLIPSSQPRSPEPPRHPSSRRHAHKPERDWGAVSEPAASPCNGFPVRRQSGDVGCGGDLPHVLALLLWEKGAL